MSRVDAMLAASPWGRHVPPDQRRRLRREIRMLRLQAWLGRKGVRIVLLLLFYGLLCLIPVVMGMAVLAGIAALPLLLVPPVGYLAYWLVWREYHR